MGDWGGAAPAPPLNTPLVADNVADIFWAGSQKVGYKTFAAATYRFYGGPYVPTFQSFPQRATTQHQSIHNTNVRHYTTSTKQPQHNGNTINNRTITRICAAEIDGRTICGPQCVPKSTSVTLAVDEKTLPMATITGRTDRRTDRVRRNMRPPPREEGRIITVVLLFVLSMCC